MFWKMLLSFLHLALKKSRDKNDFKTCIKELKIELFVDVNSKYLQFSYGIILLMEEFVALD